MNYRADDLLGDLEGLYFPMKHDNEESGLRWIAVARKHLDAFPSDTLKKCYEHIITTHKARSFPSLPTLLDACQTIEKKHQEKIDYARSQAMDVDGIGWTTLDRGLAKWRKFARDPHMVLSRKMAFSEGWMGSLCVWVIENGKLPQNGDDFRQCRKGGGMGPTSADSSVLIAFGDKVFEDLKTEQTMAREDYDANSTYVLDTVTELMRDGSRDPLKAKLIELGQTILQKRA